MTGVQTCALPIFSYCANPKNPSGIDKKRGLVVGDVQSGRVLILGRFGTTKKFPKFLKRMLPE